MLTREYLEKIITSAQRAIDDYDKGSEQGIRLAIGDLNFVKDRLKAAEILLLEELRELEDEK